MRVGGLGGSAENVPPVATLLIPIAPVIADEPFVEKKKRGPATEAILTALRDHRGLFWRVGFVSLLMNLLSVVSSLFKMQGYDSVVPNLVYATLGVRASGIGRETWRGRVVGEGVM